MSSTPGVSLSSGSKPMPRIGMGTAASLETMRAAILRAIEIGYRHFDTASVYQSEAILGEAVAAAVSSGLVASRDELFVTSKLWCRDAHRDLVVPALTKTLANLQMEYVDLYLIHWPISLKPGEPAFPFPMEDLMPLDVMGVWEAMEECQRLGLAKAIGVSNFSCKKLEQLICSAKIPPAVNEVEVNPLWQQKKLREFCAGKGIQICAYSPLGGKGTLWGTDSVMDCDVLKQIAESKGKTLAQICLRWVYEQGDCLVVKSFNEGRMKENLDILDWELSEEVNLKISKIPQCSAVTGVHFVSDSGPFKTIEDVWDGET